MTVSVIIPTLNAAGLLPHLLENLNNQTLRPAEIIVADSSSGDGTAAAAIASNARVINIPPGRFDHGLTRSTAARSASGEVLVFLTQDAMPCNNRTIENIAGGLMADPSIGAAFGRQIPHRDASFWARHLRHFNYPAVSHVNDPSSMHKTGIKSVFLSNCFAAYRHSALEQIGYFKSGLILGEDTAAAAELLHNNYKTAYVAEAAVYHSHNLDIFMEFRRYFDTGVFHRTHPDIVGHTEAVHGRGLEYLKSEIAMLVSERRYGLFPCEVIRNAARYCGYLLGKNHNHFPVRINRRLSMNRAWW